MKVLVEAKQLFNYDAQIGLLDFERCTNLPNKEKKKLKCEQGVSSFVWFFSFGVFGLWILDYGFVEFSFPGMFGPKKHPVDNIGPLVFVEKQGPLKFNTSYCIFLDKFKILYYVIKV